MSSDISAGERARKALAEIDAEIKKVKADFNAANISFDEYLDRTDALAAKASTINGSFNGAMNSVKGVGAETGIATHKMMAFAGTLDDLQYVPQMGLRPILNNLMQFSPTLAIVGIGVQTLITNWDTLAGVFGQGHVKTQAEEMEELAKATKKTADEAERLGRFSRAEKGVDDLRELRPEAETKADASTKKAIGEANQKDIVAGLLKSNPAMVRAQGEAVDAQEALARALENQADVEANFGKGSTLAGLSGADEEVQKAKERLAKATDRTAEQLVANAFNSRDNPQARQQLADAIRKDPNAFGAGGKDLLAKLDLIGQGKDPAEEAKKKTDADKKADADYDKDLQERIRDAEQEAQRKTAEFAKRRDELAEPMQKQFNVSSARNEDIGVEDVQGALEQSGVTPEDASKFAKSVLEQLENKFDEELRKRAGERGTDVAGANSDIVAEDEEKKRSEEQAVTTKRDAEINKARQNAEAAEKDRADRLKRTTEGTAVDDRTKNALMRAQLSGANPEQAAERVAKQLADELKKGGFSEDDAQRAADEYVQEQAADLGDEPGPAHTNILIQ